MATTGFWPVKGKLKSVIVYAENPDKTMNPKFFDSDLYATLQYAENSNKTDQELFVSGINCSKHNAYAQMVAVKKKFGERGSVVAYHGYQSFKENEVTPEECHEIGIETARKMWGDKYQVIVTTHLDKQHHLHNHFVINSTSFKDGLKFRNKIGDHYELRKISDAICKERGKSVLENAPFYGGEKAAYWLHKQGKKTHRDMLNLFLKCVILHLPITFCRAFVISFTGTCLMCAQCVRYSSTVKSICKGGCCGRNPICLFASTGFSLRLTPLMNTFPSVGFMTPHMIFMVVDFPAPFDPSRP